MFISMMVGLFYFIYFTMNLTSIKQGFSKLQVQLVKFGELHYRGVHEVEYISTILVPEITCFGQFNRRLQKLLNISS